MRVCDIVLNSIWFDPRVRKQLIEYQENGIDVVAVGFKCPRYDAEKVKKIPCETTIVDIDPRYNGRQKGVFRKLWREHLTINGIRRAVVQTRADIIHVNDLNVLIPAYLASRKLKCKLVYDSHEINTENYVSGSRPKISGFSRIIERYIAKRVDQMVCVSHAAADYFAKEYKIRKPMVVTNCALRKDTLTEQPQKHPGFEVMAHGQFYPGRGYEEMLGAAELLKGNPEIRICLRGMGNLEESLRNTVAEKHLDNVTFYPPVQIEQLIPEAARSHVGIAITKPICLNFKLSVSNKLFEYAAAGLPVIMSDIPEHRYLNDKYHFGIILPDDSPRSLADAVLQLYRDPELYWQLAENSKRLSQEVNWENEFGKLLDAERRMLKV